MPSGLPWGLALMSGVNTYVPLLLLALVARSTDAIALSPDFAFLTSDKVIVLLAALALAEIIVEKFPVLDNSWDAAHTLVRPVAGALAAAATATPGAEVASPLAALLGALLAGGAHTAKSSLRLASTTNTLGAGNFFLSLADDAAAIGGSFLAIYAPWIMLGLVGLFVAVAILLGPRLLRAMSFNLAILISFLRHLAGRATGATQPAELRQSLMEVPSDALKAFAASIGPGEEILGVLPGWIRSRGARKATLLITPRRLVLVERRWLRSARAREVAISEIAQVRHRSLGLFSRLEWLTRENESYSLALRRTHRALGELAAREISLRAGKPAAAPPPSPEVVQVNL